MSARAGRRRVEPNSAIANGSAPLTPFVPLALPSPALHLDAPPLDLRPWASTPGDAAALAAAWTDPDVVRWTAVPRCRTQDAAAGWVAGEATRRQAGAALDLAVTEPGAVELVVGEVGLVVVDRARGWAEVGYWLLPPWRGQGRARGALALFTDWALRDLPVNRLFARTHPDNPRSGAVAERAGYQAAGHTPDGTRVWVRDRPGRPDRR